MEKRLSAFLLSLLLADWVCAEAPVSFPDERLKAAVEAALWISDPTPTDMLGLTSLDLDNRGIGSLVGLEYATNLESLVIRWNHVTDLSPLSGLTNLQELDAHNNGLTEIAPLSGLVNLRKLILRINHIRDISALSDLVLLEEVHFEWNDISDISPLSGLTHLMHVDLRSNDVADVWPLLNLPSLVFVDLRDNPLSKEACDVQIPQMVASRPGMSLRYEVTGIQRRLRISCGPGGSIIDPGSGTIIYGDNASIRIQAEANPGFRFAGWSGSCSSEDNPLLITMSEDREIRANFVSVLDAIHVDNSGWDHSQPDVPAGSDPIEDGTAEHPFDQIQEAIEVAADGATILVHPGTYHESIDFLGKSIEMTGENPEDPNEMTWPVIQGMPGKSVVSFTEGKDPNCLLRGFVLTGGNGPQAGGIWCSRSSVTIANCLIAGNRASDPNGSTVCCMNSRVVLVNCTIADNHTGAQGATLCSVDSHVSVVNSILWDTALRQIVQVGGGEGSANYSDVAGGWAHPGCISADPMFADVGCWVDCNDPSVVLEPEDPNAIWVMGDYHLQSQAGRWDPKTAQWVQDKATSPCIDAGDPATPVGREPSPNGGVINLGAYGGTTEAGGSFPVNLSP